MEALTLLVYAVISLALLALYVWTNDRRLKAIPGSIASLAQRPTEESIRSFAEDMARRNGTKESPEEEMKRQVPQKTGRKYIITGGVSGVHCPLTL